MMGPGWTQMGIYEVHYTNVRFIRRFAVAILYRVSSWTFVCVHA